MHTLIFAGGTIRSGKAIASAIANADLVIAADGGAKSALYYHCIPSIVVGDFDSLDATRLEEITAQGCQCIRLAVEKDETDTEMAIQAAIERGAETITLLGALGGARVDHTLANLLLLTGFKETPIRIVDGPSICWLLCGPGTAQICGQTGDLLSLFPLDGDAHGVSTTNLYYPLCGETLHSGKPRGVSNILTQERAAVTIEQGMLLIIHTDEQERKTWEEC